ncbi:hypothetical protein CsatA_026057 [Cannabis sativa]
MTMLPLCYATPTCSSHSQIAFQKVYIAIEGFEKTLGFDPNDPIVPFVLLAGTSATLCVDIQRLCGRFVSSIDFGEKETTFLIFVEKLVIAIQASFISLNLHRLDEQLAKDVCRATEISEANSSWESDQIPATNDRSTLKEISEDLIDSLANISEVKAPASLNPSLGFCDSSKQIDDAKSFMMLQKITY